MTYKRVSSSPAGQEAYGNKMAEDGLDVKSMDHTDKEFHLAGDYRNIMAR